MMRKKSLPLALAIAAGLVGCATPAPEVAGVAVPAAYGRGDPLINAPVETLDLETGHPARAVTADPWWQGFGDQRLDRLVAEVLAVNTDLAAAGLRLRQARLQAGLADHALWPQPGGSVSSSGSRAIDRSDEVRRSNSASVFLNWEVDLWGRLRAQRDVAAWEASATAEDLENTALLLVNEACRQYWQLAYLNQRIATGEANLERLSQIEALVKVQFDAGEVSLLEVREAAQSLDSQRVAQSQLRQQRIEARNAITLLLDGNPWPLADEPHNLDTGASLEVREGLPSELLGRRPDLRAAELRLRKALAAIGVTVRSYYPALTLTGSLGSSATSLGQVLENPVATLGAGLSLPFLDWRERQLDVELVGTGYEIVANDFRRTLYTALSEVDNALSARQQLVTQVAAAERSLRAAEDVERMYQVRYQVGASDLRTWLDAQQSRRDAELAFAQARLSQLVNDGVLALALGGG